MTDISELSAQWIAARHDEDSAKSRRVAIEDAIVSAVGAKPEGETTRRHGDYKITPTGKMTRKLDADKWAEIEHSVPEPLRPVSYRPALDAKGLKYLQDNEPDVYRIVAQAIETKPAKTAVSVKKEEK